MNEIRIPHATINIIDTVENIPPVSKKRSGNIGTKKIRITMDLIIKPAPTSSTPKIKKITLKIKIANKNISNPIKNIANIISSYKGYCIFHAKPIKEKSSLIIFKSGKINHEVVLIAYSLSI